MCHVKTKKNKTLTDKRKLSHKNLSNTTVTHSDKVEMEGRKKEKHT